LPDGLRVRLDHIVVTQRKFAEWRKKSNCWVIDS
jgi:hypothetical protein